MVHGSCFIHQSLYLETPPPLPDPPQGLTRPVLGGALPRWILGSERQQTLCLPAASLVRGSGAGPVAYFFKILITAGARFLRQA